MRNPKRSLVLAAWILLVPAGVIEAAPATDPAAAGDIRFSFKLDPRLAGGTYGGERWVSPPSYTGIGGQDSVEARAKVLDAAGASLDIGPTWTADDPAMVSVTPAQGNRVTITVKRAGASRLRVSAQGVSKDLSVTAAVRNDLLQVRIAQPETSAPAKVGDARKTPAGTPALKPAFESEKDKHSYALGANVANSLRKQSIEVDPDLLIQGFKDAFSGGEPRLTEAEVRAVLIKLQRELKRKQAALQAERNKVLAEKNQKVGAAFLAENKAREGVITLESGLQYKVLTAGEGQRPKPDDRVVVQYRGALVDGTEFDSSHARGKPASFAVNQVIPGWREALQLMPVGSKWQLFVPPELGYGERGTGRKIGPNTTLVFEVELIEIKERSGADSSASDPVTDIKVSHKLDPKVSGGPHLGERRVSPITYTGARRVGDESMIESKAQSVAARDQPITSPPQAKPEEPQMVAVSPEQEQGDRVNITVNHSGESRLPLVSNGFFNTFRSRPAATARPSRWT